MKQRTLSLVIALVLALSLLAACGEEAPQSNSGFGEFQWPSNGIASMLPAPESNIGCIEWESSDSFNVDVGETTKEQYVAYVDACMEKGFTVDYYRDDDSFDADHESGASLSIYYEDGNIMSIDIYMVDDEADDSASEAESEPVSEPASEAASAPASQGGTEAGSVEWKEFLEEYEAWVDKYIALVKKYSENPADITILTEYTQMTQELIEWSEKAGEVEIDLADDAEALAEYLETMERILQKLQTIEALV